MTWMNTSHSQRECKFEDKRVHCESFLDLIRLNESRKTLLSGKLPDCLPPHVALQRPIRAGPCTSLHLPLWQKQLL